MAGRRRWLVWTSYAVVQVGVIMSCAPYLSNTHPEIRSLPFAWQCPTPSPVPTVLLGYAPAPPAYPAPSAEPVPPDGYPAPPDELVPIYSTPVPTATPYIRTGADFFARQRVAIGPLIVAAEPFGTKVRVTLENRTAAPVELHLTLSVVRTARRDDGQLVEGAWNALDDGPGVLDPRSTTTVDLSFRDLPGAPQEWGMPFFNDEQRRSGSSGNGYAWWSFRPDPYCGGQAGGPPSDSYRVPQPVDAPVVGRAGWPVPNGTVISRGYGCHAYWTGVRGANCPPGQPWWHNGIDFANDLGTPIFAVAPMTIVIAGSVDDCAGNFIRGRDANGTTYDFYHLQGFASGVRAGAQVAAGAVIAQMGSTGCSTGAHLHLTVRAPDRREINPFNLLQP